MLHSGTMPPLFASILDQVHLNDDRRHRDHRASDLLAVQPHPRDARGPPGDRRERPRPGLRAWPSRSTCRLLTQILQAGAVVGLFALVVIFQPELRRALERIGRVGSFGWLLSPAESRVVVHVSTEVARAAAELSADGQGALIVLERETGLEEVAETGVMIHGDVSADLLRTIFTPRSPLHDGAVIIRDDRIVAAGALLPLAETSIQTERFGTRHRAALGITEQTDAIVVVVVSEENGQISLVERARIVRNLTEAGLARAIQGLLDPAGGRRGAFGWRSANQRRGRRRALAAARASSAASSGARRPARATGDRCRATVATRDSAARGASHAGHRRRHRSATTVTAPSATPCRRRRAASSHARTPPPAATTMPSSPRRPPGRRGEADPPAALQQLATQARGGRSRDPDVRRAGAVAEHADLHRRRSRSATSTSRPTRSVLPPRRRRSQQVRYFAPSGVQVAASSFLATIDLAGLRGQGRRRQRPDQRHDARHPDHASSASIPHFATIELDSLVSRADVPVKVVHGPVPDGLTLGRDRRSSRRP